MWQSFLVRYYPRWEEQKDKTAESFADFMLRSWSMVERAHIEKICRSGWNKPTPMLGSLSCWNDKHSNCKLIECECICHQTQTVKVA